MGIQIKGSNDTISASDGSMTLEGQTLAFTNENITGVSTMATGHITGTATIDDDLKVGISTLFVDKSTGKTGLGSDVPSSRLQVCGKSTLHGYSEASVEWGDTSNLGALSFTATAGNPIVRANTGKDLVFQTNGGNTRFVIDSDGKVGISSGTINQEGNALLIRGPSTFQTRYGHIMLTGDGATVGEGPQIVFSESGSGSNNAGAYIGHVRQGSNSIGDLVFGTRGTTGDANTVPTERIRIKSSGLVGIGTDNPGQTLHLSAATGDVYNRVDTNVNGGLLLYVQGTQRSIIANDSAFSGTITDTGIGAKGNMIFRTGTSSYTERLRITSAGLARIQSTDARGAQELLQIKHINTTTTGDGPAFLLNGEYSSNPWAFAKICSVNSGSGYGADFQIHVHPADSTQGSSVVKALSILGDGAGANVTVTDGNLVIGTSGHGVDFSATGQGTGSMSSELLDDYEEGSWTAGAQDFDGSVTTNSSVYIKVGNVVHVQAYISISNTTDSSDVRITGLPFTAAGGSAVYSQMATQTSADVADPILRTQGGTAILRGCKYSGGDGDAKISYTDVKGKWFIFGGTYYAD